MNSKLTREGEMMNPAQANKEMKRRFFRKKGLSKQQPGSSLDTPSSSNSPSPSFEGGLLEGGQYRGMRGGGGGSGGISGSLDEEEIKMNRRRHFQAEPRRARSAERFDKLRVSHNSSSPGGDFSAYSYAISGELLPLESSTPPRLRGGDTVLSRSSPKRQFSTGIPSPPPPYTSAVTNGTSGPPSYRQAMKMNPPATANSKTYTINTDAGSRSYSRGSVARYAMQQQRGAQSFDTGYYYGTTGVGGLRQAASVPAFNEELCSCSKCQVMKEMDYNDQAVYMESQAFLMNDILTDGLTFCSIM